MKGLLARILYLLGGLAVGLWAGLRLPTKQRLKLSRQLGGLMGGMVEPMPAG
jgi:hypothetical protein